MSRIDILLLVVLDFGLVRGFMCDLITEMTSLLAIIVGIYGAIHSSLLTARPLGELMPNSQQTIEVVAFGIMLIALILAVMPLAKVLTKMLKAAELGFLNRLARALFGVLEAAVIVGSLPVSLERTFQIGKWLSPSAFSESVLYEPMRSISAVAYVNVF